MSTIYTIDQLLSVCNADNTQVNRCIAQTILNIYNKARNFYQEDMIASFKDFLTSGKLDFTKYNIHF